jgi:lipoate synthase
VEALKANEQQLTSTMSSLREEATLFRESKVEVMAHWLEKHTTDITPHDIYRYAYSLYDAKLPSMTRVAKKLIKDSDLLDNLGFDEDDVEEIIQAMSEHGLINVVNDDDHATRFFSTFLPSRKLGLPACAPGAKAPAPCLGP